MVVTQGLRLAVAGIVVGLLTAFALARVLAGLLFGVRPHDPLVFVSVPVALLGVTLLAVWAPARRASRLDPVIALRSE
jgi:putative ABC transport system permease protein